MTCEELIKRLRSFPADSQVMILDGFNAGGCPREINVGPHPRVVSEKDAEESADAEALVGETVVVLGYGCD